MMIMRADEVVVTVMFYNRDFARSHLLWAEACVAVAPPLK